jgi:hypothetical protein
MYKYKFHEKEPTKKAHDNCNNFSFHILKEDITVLSHHVPPSQTM